MRKKRGRGRPPKANPKDPKAAGRKAKQREWDQREEAKLRQLRALDEGIAPHQLNISARGRLEGRDNGPGHEGPAIRRKNRLATLFYKAPKTPRQDRQVKAH